MPDSAHGKIDRAAQVHTITLDAAYDQVEVINRDATADGTGARLV